MKKYDEFPEQYDISNFPRVPSPAEAVAARPPKK